MSRAFTLARGLVQHVATARGGGADKRAAMETS